jgi:hypothetical protein
MMLVYLEKTLTTNPHHKEELLSITTTGIVAVFPGTARQGDQVNSTTVTADASGNLLSETRYSAF